MTEAITPICFTLIWLVAIAAIFVIAIVAILAVLAHSGIGCDWEDDDAEEEEGE